MISMKCINSKQDACILLKISVSDLSKYAPKMWEWLIVKPKSSKAISNHIKSQFRKDFQDKHLERAFSRMKEILSYSYNLSPKRLDEIFNAQTIEIFLIRLLHDPRDVYGFGKLLHNFTKTELARTMFEVSAEYLRDATNSKTVHDDLARVSDHFKVQSESKLDNEIYAIPANKKDRAFTKKREDELLLDKKNLIDEYNKLNHDSKVIDLTEKYNKLFYKKITLNVELKSNNKKLSVIKLKEYKNKLKRIEIEMLQIYKQLQGIEYNIHDKILDIEKKLESKYDHLAPFCCKRKFLPQFLKYVVENNQSIPEPDDGTELLIEPATNGYNAFSMPVSHIPKDHIITDEIRKYYTSPSHYFNILKDHDKIKWYGSEPSVSLDELKKYPPLNRFFPSGYFSIIPISNTLESLMDIVQEDIK